MDAVVDKFEVFSAKVNIFFVVDEVAVCRITCIISLGQFEKFSFMTVELSQVCCLKSLCS